jgi:hypothetical protein
MATASRAERGLLRLPHPPYPPYLRPDPSPTAGDLVLDGPFVKEDAVTQACVSSPLREQRASVPLV